MIVPNQSDRDDDSFLPELDLDVLRSAARRDLEQKLQPLTTPTDTQVVEQRARETMMATGSRLVEGATGLATTPYDQLDILVAYATAGLTAYDLGMPAATILSFHLGNPHSHMGQPRPSGFGAIVTGCLSVLINGLPAARAGDLGFAPTCGGLTPIFQVAHGSSSVFIGGARAARAGDLTKQCEPAAPRVEKLLGLATTVPAIGGSLAKSFGAMERAEVAAADAVTASSATAASLAAEAEGQQLAACIHAAQAATDAIALALQAVMGLDPGLPGGGGLVLTIGHDEVRIGGVQLPPSSEILLGAAKKLAPVASVFGGARRRTPWIFDVLRRGRTANALPRWLRRFTGDPVDILGGSFVLDAVDAELPGALPLRFARHYSSTWAGRSSPLGRGWSHNHDEAVWREPGGRLVYRAHDGRELELSPGDRDLTFCPRHRLTLRPLGPHRWQISDADGLVREFAPVAPARPGDPDGLARIVALRDRAGHTLHYHYEDHALVAVRAADGRELAFHYHPDGRLARLDLPDPDRNGLVPHTHFFYDGEDLTEVHDALGQVTRHRHDNHKIVERVLPGGLRFRFEYDGHDPDARCTRTAGDGGVLDHSLVHDRARRTTLVTNACGEVGIYRAGPHGEVVEVTDARGATTRFEYDEHLRPTAEVDPLGHVTRFEYDARGNRTRTVTADGAVTTVEYDDRDLPVAATDPAGGRWRWSFDERGRPTRRTDPLGRATTFAYTPAGHGHTAVDVRHPGGLHERRLLDPAGRPVRIDLSDGTYTTYRHDRRGRLVETTDARGNVLRRHYDLLGRLTCLELPGGEVRHFGHDALGNLVRACDARSDLRMHHGGLGWLERCGGASDPPWTLERDLEGRLLRVAGAAGEIWRAERDAVGRVRVVQDARGRRRLTRDLAGRVVAVAHADGLVTTYTRDPAGRPLQIDHGDRTVDRFTYRADGLLVAATRHHPDGTVSELRRERDATGRVLREWQDGRWVAVAHDLRGRVTHLRSELGADLRFHHDDRGLGRVAWPAVGWEVRFERDRDGREQARHLPGGVTSWWHRDDLGRPVEHGVTGSRPPQIHRHRRLSWTPDHRLAADLDLTAPARASTRTRKPAAARPSEPAVGALPSPPPASPTHHHDARGRRVATELPDGTAWRYRWNAADELVEVTCPFGQVLTYRHDALGRRIACRVARRQGVEDAPWTRWHFHGEVPLHLWTDGDPASLSTWLFDADGAPLARLSATARDAVVTDPFGAPWSLFDERGAASSASACLFPRTGAELDPTTGLHHRSSRMFDPATDLHHRGSRVFDPASGEFLDPGPVPRAAADEPRFTDLAIAADERPVTVAALLAAELAQDPAPVRQHPNLRDIAIGPWRER